MVRSSSAIEAAAASLLCQTQDPTFVMRCWFDHVIQRPILLILDAKVAYDCLSLRGALADPTTASFCRWIPGQQQASDSLTKFRGDSVLLSILTTGQWTIVEDESWQQVRAQQRVTQKACKDD